MRGGLDRAVRIAAIGAALVVGDAAAQEKGAKNRPQQERVLAVQEIKKLPKLPSIVPAISTDIRQRLDSESEGKLSILNSKLSEVWGKDTEYKSQFFAYLYEKIAIQVGVGGVTPEIEELARQATLSIDSFEVKNIPETEIIPQASLALAFAMIVEQDEMLHALGKIGSLLNRGVRKQGADGNISLLFDRPEYSEFLTTLVARYQQRYKNRTGAIGEAISGARGGLYLALNKNFRIARSEVGRTELLSKKKILELLEVFKVTPELIEKRYQSIPFEQRESFFGFDFWHSIPSPQKKIFLTRIFTDASRTADQYHVLAKRDSWRSHMMDADWHAVLKEAGSKPGGPDGVIAAMSFDSDYHAIRDDELPLVKDLFLHVVNPQIRVLFMQKARFHGQRAMSDFQKSILDSNPIELLVLQNRRPRAIEPKEATMFGISTIFQDRAFAHIGEVKTALLPEDIQRLHPVEVAHWKAWITRNLFFRNDPVTPASIVSMVNDIKAQRERVAAIEPFRSAHVVVVAHGEMMTDKDGKRIPRFGTQPLLDGLKDPRRGAAADVQVVSPFKDFINGDHRIDADSRMRAYKATISAITNTRAPLTLFFDAHGGAKRGGQSGSIYLTDGEVDNIVSEEPKPRQVVETKDTTKIEAEAIADAWIKRYDGSNPEALRALAAGKEWMVFSACASPNIGRQIAARMSEKGVSPPSMIFMSEFGQNGYSHFFLDTHSNFSHQTLGLGDKLDSESMRKWGVTINGVIQRAPQQWDSRPGVLVPEFGPTGESIKNSKGLPRYMQISGLGGGYINAAFA